MKYPCPLCENGYSTVAALKWHVIRQHSKKTRPHDYSGVGAFFQCQLCKTCTCSSSDLLDSHIRRFHENFYAELLARHLGLKEVN